MNSDTFLSLINYGAHICWGNNKGNCVIGKLDEHNNTIYKKIIAHGDLISEIPDMGEYNLEEKIAITYFDFTFEDPITKEEYTNDSIVQAWPINPLHLSLLSLER